MSTTYGTITIRQGDQVRVEAYGAIGIVKLEKVEDGVTVGFEVIALNDEREVDNLIDALELAREHCWGERL